MTDQFCFIPHVFFKWCVWLILVMHCLFWKSAFSVSHFGLICLSDKGMKLLGKMYSAV